MFNEQNTHVKNNLLNNINVNNTNNINDINIKNVKKINEYIDNNNNGLIKITNNETLIDYIFEIKQDFNYYKILLTNEEKTYLNFLTQINNFSNNFHFNLYFSLFIEKNINAMIHENKIIYYIEYLKNEKQKKLEGKNYLKKCIKIYGIRNVKQNDKNNKNNEYNKYNENDKFVENDKCNDLINNENNIILKNNIEDKSSNIQLKNDNTKNYNKRKADNLSDDLSCKKMKHNNVYENMDNIKTKKNFNENEHILRNDIEDEKDDQNIFLEESMFLKEKIIYNIHESIRQKECVMSNVYCAHIKLSIFFNMFFYKSYDIYKIFSSSLYVYCRKFKNFKSNNKIIKFMNLSHITHFLIIKFLLKFLREIKEDSEINENNIRKNINLNKNFNRNSNTVNQNRYRNKLDFYFSYKFLDYVLNINTKNASIFLNYINKVILHLYEKKKNHIVLSIIITLSIYNFLILLETNNNINELEKKTLNEICIDIYKNSLIGKLLRLNNFYIEKDLKYINIKNIYQYEIENHLKFISEDINKEMYELIYFKKHLFQKGDYKKIDIIKIRKKNVTDNFLFTSEILNYIYYSSLYILIHLICNIRFYYNIYKIEYKQNYYLKDEISYYVYENNKINKINNETKNNIFNENILLKNDIKKKENILLTNNTSEENAILNIILKLDKNELDIYLNKKRYIIKFYKKVKNNLINNFKCYFSVNNVNKYIKNLNYEKMFFKILFNFDSCFLFNSNINFYINEKEIKENKNYEMNEINENQYINGIDNENIEDVINKKYSNILNEKYELNFLKKIKNIYTFVDKLNKIIDYIIQNEHIYSKYMNFLINETKCNDDSDNFDINFYFYEIIDDNEDNIINNLNDFKEDNEKSNYINILCIFKYQNNIDINNIDNNDNNNENNVNKKIKILFNELFDYILSSIIINKKDKKEKILFWVHFLYNIKNFSLINFHIFFYLSSIIKKYNENINNQNLKMKSKNDILKKKIKICEQIYILYLFKFTFLMNISIYEVFEIFISTITVLFNYNFFDYYLNQKIMSIEKTEEINLKIFLLCLKKDVINVVSNNNILIFIKCIRYLSDSLFLRKTLKLLILKSYSFINFILHILPLKTIVVDMNKIKCLKFIKENKNDKVGEYLYIKKNIEMENNQKNNIHNNDQQMKEINNLKLMSENDNKIKNEYEINTLNYDNKNYSSSTESDELNDSLSFFKYESNEIYEEKIKENIYDIKKENEKNNTLEKNTENNNNNIDNEKLWLYPILKIFYYKSFLCFMKIKTKKEDIYDRIETMLFFYFNKKKNNYHTDIETIIDCYKLKHLKNEYFIYLYKHSMIIKWLCLKIFILNKFKYKKYTTNEIFEILFKEINFENKKEEYITYRITSNYNIIHFDLMNIKNMCYIFISYIANELLLNINDKLKKHNINIDDEKDVLEKKNKDIENINIQEYNNNIKSYIEIGLHDEINIYTSYFITTFYPYLYETFYSYDIFFNLFKIFLNLYILNKNSNLFNTSIYLYFLILVRILHFNIYLSFIYISKLKSYLKSNDVASFISINVKYDEIVTIFKESVNYFINNNKGEEYIYEDIKVIYDIYSILLFYHMFINDQ